MYQGRHLKIDKLPQSGGEQDGLSRAFHEMRGTVYQGSHVRKNELTERKLDWTVGARRAGGAVLAASVAWGLAAVPASAEDEPRESEASTTAEVIPEVLNDVSGASTRTEDSPSTTAPEEPVDTEDGAGGETLLEGSAAETEPEEEAEEPAGETPDDEVPEEPTGELEPAETNADDNGDDSLDSVLDDIMGDSEPGAVEVAPNEDNEEPTQETPSAAVADEPAEEVPVAEGDLETKEPSDSVEEISDEDTPEESTPSAPVTPAEGPVEPEPAVPAEESEPSDTDSSGLAGAIASITGDAEPSVVAADPEEEAEEPAEEGTVDEVPEEPTEAAEPAEDGADGDNPGGILDDIIGDSEPGLVEANPGEDDGGPAEDGAGNETPGEPGDEPPTEGGLGNNEETDPNEKDEDGQVEEPKKSVTEIAQEVLDNKWGINEERKKLLTEAGYDYDAVQAEVNRILEEQNADTGGPDRITEVQENPLNLPVEYGDAPALFDMDRPEQAKLIAKYGEGNSGRLANDEMVTIRAPWRDNGMHEWKFSPGAARAFEALAVEFEERTGHKLCFTQTYRSYEKQVQSKKDHGAYAATPGWSKHGWADAGDVCDFENPNGAFTRDSETYKVLEEIGPKYGIVNPHRYDPRFSEHHEASKQIDEPWHFEFVERYYANYYVRAA